VSGSAPCKSQPPHRSRPLSDAHARAPRSGKNATSHVMVPNAQVIGATIANLSARPAHLLIVPVHVRSGLHPCSKVRKAMATAAVAFDAALADTLERAGVADSAAAASRLPKASYFGPLEVGERGMKWELRCEAPMQAQRHCTGTPLLPRSNRAACARRACLQPWHTRAGCPGRAELPRPPVHALDALRL
jgi:hypothetical protein